jgi:subtilisin family serine protease
VHLPPRILIAIAVFFAASGSARADLVQLNWTPGGESAARAAGGEELAPELRIWRVPSYAVADLRSSGFVAIARPERFLPVASAALTQATDPLVPAQWWRTAIGADRADSPGPGKPLTVVDSGIDLSHPEFVSRPNTTALNPQTVTDQDEDHGTEVSSVAAAPNNGVGLVGVYPDAVLRIWDASPFGFLNEGAAIEGIYEAARQGPGVINLSFGGEDDDPLLDDAIRFAFREGSLVVAAAGNEGLQGSPPNYPAFYPHVLTIGATNENNSVAAFSTESRFVDLAAPGVRMPVAEPVSQEPSGYLTAVSGTSFSAPLVAGAAAWVWTVRPQLTNTQLFEIMRRSATDLGSPGFDQASGYGLLNIPAALAYKAPFKDPQEPNETPHQIEPRGLFPQGTPPLTGPGRTNANIVARVDHSEDPLDLYRVWAPAGRTLRARVTGDVTVRLLKRANRAPELAVDKRGVASWKNAGKGVYVYVEVRPATRLDEYRLRVTAARK